LSDELLKDNPTKPGGPFTIKPALLRSLRSAATPAFFALRWIVVRLLDGQRLRPLNLAVAGVKNYDRPYNATT
jgi:hypothetical protein